mmetsp:Transcript_5808/g.18640  ORF Transcript_5808/g.18640 Transcript_5808/m.18640 type:complete len:93 (+) Transcript_5808:843-1121(+)
MHACLFACSLACVHACMHAGQARGPWAVRANGACGAQGPACMRACVHARLRACVFLCLLARLACLLVVFAMFVAINIGIVRGLHSRNCAFAF